MQHCEGSKFKLPQEKERNILNKGQFALHWAINDHVDTFSGIVDHHCLNFLFIIRQSFTGVVIVWQLDLQLPMQSVFITTNVVSLNPAYGDVYAIKCDKVCQWLAAGWWFSPGTPVSSTNKIDRHDITEILLKVALNTITLTLIYVLSYGWVVYIS